MIPYDDLVIALQTWRAKQGLPVAQLSGALTPPPPVEQPAFVAAAPAGFPQRAAPPAAPLARNQGFLGNVATPPPLAANDDSLDDVDASALIEESHYEPEGDDFAMAFAAGKGGDQGEEATAISAAPAPRLSDQFGLSTEPGADNAPTDDLPLKPKHHRNDDW